MAAVRQRFERGVYDFAHKTRSRHLLESQKKHAKSAIQASSLPAGFLWGDIQKGEPSGAEKTADGVTDRVLHDGHTRVTPLFGIVVAEYNSYPGLNKKYLFHSDTQVQNFQSKLLRYWSYAKFKRSARRPQSLGSQCLCCGFGQSVFIRAYSGNDSRSEPLYKSKTGYYEILEVSPKATQAQIKTAYYKQSFIYHPDRNAGSEVATVRFSEINEAYTVLGNKGLRKKYDLGLLSQSDLVVTAKPSGRDTSGSSTKQQTGSRRSVMGADSRGGVFDFDKFFKSHYSEQLQRQQEVRVRKEEKRKKQETMDEMKLGRMTEIGICLMVVMAAAILLSMK